MSPHPWSPLWQIQAHMNASSFRQPWFFAFPSLLYLFKYDMLKLIGRLPQSWHGWHRGIPAFAQWSQPQGVQWAITDCHIKVSQYLYWVWHLLCWDPGLPDREGKWSWGLVPHNQSRQVVGSKLVSEPALNMVSLESRQRTQLEGRKDSK